MKTFHILAVALAILSGCKTTPPEADLLSAQSFTKISDVPPIKCDREPDYFGLTTGESPADVAVFNFPARASGGAPTLVGANSTYNARFDTCINDSSEFVLKQIVLMGLNMEPITVVSVGENAKLDGFGEALFGDYSKLNVDVAFETIQSGASSPVVASKRRFVFRGQHPEGAASGTAAALVIDEPQPGVLRPEYIAAQGVLTSGDPLASRICQLGFSESPETSTIGSVTLDWILCRGFGSSGTRPFTIGKMTLVDNATNLPANLRGKKVVLEGAALESAVKLKINHHNVCDSLVIKTAQAVYGMTASREGNGGGTCPPVLEGAPLPGGWVTYRFAYTTGQAKTGSVANCKHFDNCGTP